MHGVDHRGHPGGHRAEQGGEAAVIVDDVDVGEAAHRVMDADSPVELAEALVAAAQLSGPGPRCGQVGRGLRALGGEEGDPVAAPAQFGGEQPDDQLDPTVAMGGHRIPGWSNDDDMAAHLTPR